MSLYDSPKDESIINLFKWLRKEGALTMSKMLLVEYTRSGNQKILVLINELNRKGRYNLIPNQKINSFNKDRHFKYTCNYKDRSHAKLVFLSYRKKMIANDNALIKDVNSFSKIDGIKPCACNTPQNCCFR